MADLETRTQDVSIRDEDTGYPAGVDSQGRLKTAAELEVTIKELTGFDNIADTWFQIINAGGVGDTIRVQIVLPDAVDITSTLTSNEAGDIVKTAELVRDNLNNDTTFALNWEAKAICGIVMVIAKVEAECGERENANSLIVTPTGTTTVDIPVGNDVIVRRTKPAEIFSNPADNRIGSLAFRGEVSSVIKAKRPVFISEIAPNTAPGIIQMVVDRDLDTFITEPSLSENDEVFLGEFVFGTIGKQVEFLVGTGYDKGSKKTFLASEGGASRDLYEVEYYLMKDHRGNSGTYDAPNNALLVVEKWNGSEWVLLTHANFDILDIPQKENSCQIKLSVTAPPAGGDGIRINYAKMTKRSRFRIGVDTNFEWTPSVPLKIKEGELIAVSANQVSAGGGSAIVNISGFPINAKTGTI